MNITIIGSGLIGRGWSMIFASQGHKITLFDISTEILESAQKTLQSDLKNHEKNGSLRNSKTYSADQQISFISFSSDLNEAVRNANYIQECVPEDLSLKHKVWTNIEKALIETKNESIEFLASSTSCLLPKLLFQNLQNEKFKKIAFVAHPINPPYFVPLVEICPNFPITKETTVEKAKKLLTGVGQKPVILKKQVDGFALNRLQYPVINAAYQMYKNQVLNAEDLDTVMVHGLGMRYACIGALETCHLNANGFKDYFEKYGPSVTRISDEIMDQGGLSYKFNHENEQKTVEKIDQEMVQRIPLEKLCEARDKRDHKLAFIAKME